MLPRLGVELGVNGQHLLALDHRLDRCRPIDRLRRRTAAGQRGDRDAFDAQVGFDRAACILALKLVELPLARKHPQRIRDARLQGFGHVVAGR